MLFQLYISQKKSTQKAVIFSFTYIDKLVIINRSMLCITLQCELETLPKN